MSRLTKDRQNKRKTIKGVWGIASSIMGGLSAISLPEILANQDYFLLPILLILNLPFVIVYLSIPGKKTIRYTQNDKDIFIIVFNFLSYLEFIQDEIFSKLKSVFNTHPLAKTIKLYNKIRSEETSISGSCKNIAEQLAEIRFYTIYTVLDLASEDKILTIDEYDYIKTIRDLLRIPKKTFKYIMNAYMKKGLQDERKILEEESRQKLAKSFLPYNAYKILGVSPTVTKEQLKKVYRKLAKKYHPDKYHGQSEEIIQKAEDKFHEITEVYEIIETHKKF